MIGWIKIHRKMLDSDLWKCESFTRGQAWVDLILLANHTNSFFYKRGVKINVDRGQVGRSEVELSARWLWSRSKVRKFLKDLEKEQQIIQHKTNVTQLLTVVNYDLYQEKEQQPIHQKNTRRTPEEHQKNTYKNVKNVKNVKNEEEKEKINNPFSDSFLLIWDRWKEYKRDEYKFKYKSVKTENVALEALLKISGGNEKTALEIIHQSIANGWKGFFKLKNGDNGKHERRKELSRVATEVIKQYPDL